MEKNKKLKRKLLHPELRNFLFIGHILPPIESNNSICFLEYSDYYNLAKYVNCSNVNDPKVPKNV